MPCNMPSKGERLQLLVAKGDKSVKEILEKAMETASRVEVAKLESLLELEETILFYSHIINGGIVSACIERAGGKLADGEAIDYLRAHLSDIPLTGYVEVSKISKSAYELDLESEPEARLRNPVTLEEFIGGVSGQAAAEEGEEEVEERHAEAVPQASVDEEIPLSPEKLADPSLVNEIELATMMIYLLTKSEIIRQSRDPLSLLEEARKRSMEDKEAFYRIAIEFANGEIYNAFYHGGKLCSVIYVSTEGFSAQALAHASEEELRKTLEERKDGIRRAVIYRVLCKECAKVVLRNCPEEASELYEKGRVEKEEKEKEVRRRFRLLGFLRRI